MLKAAAATLACLLLTAFAPASALNDPLTEDQAKRFVTTLPAVQALGEEMNADGKIGKMQVDLQPKAGEPFTPYTTAIAALKKKYPADHARLAGAVKPYGFNAAEWASIGDKVMIAYLAVKMQEEDPRSMAMMEGMDSSMLDMMPPEMRDQMQSAFAMLETVRNTPDEDRKAVMAAKDELDAYMKAQGRP